VLAAQADRIMALPVARANLQKRLLTTELEKVPIITKDPAVFPQYNGLKTRLTELPKVLTDVHGRQNRGPLPPSSLRHEGHGDDYVPG
jgi:hypothetical protein